MQLTDLDCRSGKNEQGYDSEVDRDGVSRGEAGRRERGRGNGNTSLGTIRDAGFAGGKTF
jgi:hypothetical protein